MSINTLENIAYFIAGVSLAGMYYELVFRKFRRIVDCPHSVDEATVPKLGLGIEHLPAEQVVFNYSISYARMKEAKKLLQIRHTNSDFNNRDEREDL